MLGRYENFPRDIHSIAFLRQQNELKNTQQAILITLHKMNGEKYGLCDLMPYLKEDCNVGFEFGIADGNDFVFLDDVELYRCLEMVEKQVLKTLDFFSIVRYHLNKNQRKVPLRFDYNLFRFMFSNRILELQVRHEKGIQRFSIDELVNFVIKKINTELLQGNLMPLYFDRTR